MLLHVSGPVRNGLEERLRFSEGFEDRRVNLVHRVPFRSADLEYFAPYTLRLHSIEGRDPGQSTSASNSVWRNRRPHVSDDGGVVSRGPVYYDLFEEFADLATQGMCPIGAPDERGHKDGWGLACFQDGALTMHMRDAGCAADAAKYYGTAWKIAKLNIERAPGR